MKTTNLNDLIEVVRRIRDEKYPQLDMQFLEAVVRAEEDNPEDDEEGLRSIRQALTRALSSKGEG